MTEDYVSSLFGRIKEMPEEQRSRLDPIAHELSQYRREGGDPGSRVLGNRIVALAAVDLFNEWERLVLERE